MNRLAARSCAAAVAALALACVAVPVHATAGEQEWSVAAGGGGSSLGSGGWIAGVDGQWLYHASDFWAWGGSLRGRAGPQQQSAVAYADARFTVDALQWIPSLAIGAGGGWQHGEAAAWAIESRVELSLGYRVARGYGWVVRGAWEQAWPGRGDAAAGSRWLLSIGWTAYRGRGIGLDL